MTRIVQRDDGRLVYRGDLLRGDLFIVPPYYVSICGMKGIVLDLYDGQPDENDDIYEHCRCMLENGEFENIATWDLTKVESRQ